MRVTGLIVEYNPFHNGHLYHLDQSISLTRPDLVVAVMSGNFVQRGEPAIADKWARTTMALTAGVDVVVELPVVFACSSAREFASGAVKLLHNLAVTDMVFGAEHDDLDQLWKIAKNLEMEPAPFRQVLHSKLEQGYSFASARAQAIEACLPGTYAIISMPNNILAVSYLQSLVQQRYIIKPHIIKRKGASYHSTEAGQYFSSATAIRQAILDTNTTDLPGLPQVVAPILKKELHRGRAPVTIDSFAPVLFWKLRTTSIEELDDLFDMEQGLSHRLHECSRQCTHISDMIDCVTTKRYTRTRVQRILMHLLLNIDKQTILDAKSQQTLPYARILGMRKEKTPLIKKWRETLEIPFVQQAAKYNPCDKVAKKMWQIDLSATDVYFLGCPNASHHRAGRDYTTQLVIL